MSRRFSLLQFVGVLLVTVALAGAVRAEPETKARPWTLAEARQQLNLHPNDPYLQFVALQLARSDDERREVVSQIDSLTGRRRGPERSVDLFALFSAAHAIQETLQLDTMTGEDDPLGEMGIRARETVRVASLQGPTVKSHPWGKMLAAQAIAGKRPEVSDLARAVPEDQYFVRFESVEKLLQLTELGDRWGTHVMAQTIGQATTSLTSSRLREQLAIVIDPWTRPFYDQGIEAVAMTGSDLYFRTGSDTTLLFAVKQPKLFRMRMDGFLDAAEQSSDDATRTTGRIFDVEYVHVETPDRRVCVYSAYPRPDLHLRGNSKAALARVLAVILGREVDGRKIASLGDSTEFKYIRTLMPSGAEEEDGLIYLSDPFIRRVVGPELKLTAQRRMLCYNHLRMIGHGAMLMRTQTGRVPESLDEVIAEGCLPDRFGTGESRCPDGGKYTLSADGVTAVCSRHGHARALVPCRDVAVDAVTAAEAEQYRQFVEEYSRYWRRFFDPIVIRLSATPKEYRAETIILPLIDNSLYSDMAEALGGEPEPLDTLPVPKRNIFSMVTRFNKPQPDDPVWQKLGAPAFPFFRYRGGEISGSDAELMKQCFYEGIGNQIGFHVYDDSPTFDFALTEALGEILRNFRGGRNAMDNEMFFVSYLIASLNAPVYIGLPVQDAQLVDQTLNRLDDHVAELARAGDERGWFGVEMDFYHAPLGASDRQMRCYSVAFGPVKWRMFYARVGDALYIASKQFILEDLLAMEAESDRSAQDPGPTAHAMVRIRPENWNEVLPMFRLGWAEASREACLNNLGPLSSVARSLAASDEAGDVTALCQAADQVHGVHFFCPDGGQYELSDAGRQVACGRHGTALAPRQATAPAEESPMGKLMEEFGGVTLGLTFLEDGLHALVTIERK